MILNCILQPKKNGLEISSVSTFESYQAERLQLRYRTKDGQKKNVHTLNGSSLALPRVLATLLGELSNPRRN